SFRLLMLFRVEVGHHPRAANVVRHHSSTKSDQANENDGTNRGQSDSTHYQHHSTDSREKNRGAVVRLQEDESEHGSNKRSGNEQAALERGHVTLKMFSVMGNGNNQSQFRDFRRLEIHEVQIDPT